MRSPAAHHIDERYANNPIETDHSARTIAVSRPCLRALRRHRKRQDANRQAAGTASGRHDLVFASTAGTPLEPRNATRQFDALCRRAELRRIHFHDLRYTCATLLYEQGVPARVVMELLGHSAIAVTMNVYSHVMPAASRDATPANEDEDDQ
nr:tyrosine-type recombinase/integrase [Frankia sp. Cppng1_Ct_nod]